MNTRALLPLFVLGLVTPALAQFEGYTFPAQVPQAKTPAELDDFLEISQMPEAAQRVLFVDQFLIRYPGSELRGFALQYQMQAHLEMGKVAEAVAAGEAALELHPNSLKTLPALAKALPALVRPEATDDPRLAKAREYADRAFQVLKTIRIPRSLPPDQWDSMRKSMEGDLYEALGYIAAKQGHVSEAIRHLEVARRLKPDLDSILFRLAVAYEMAHRNGDAVRLYEEICAQGSSSLVNAARNALTRIRNLPAE